MLRRAARTAYSLILVASIARNGIPLDRVRLTLWILVGLSLATLGCGWTTWRR